MAIDKPVDRDVGAGHDEVGARLIGINCAVPKTRARPHDEAGARLIGINRKGCLPPDLASASQGVRTIPALRQPRKGPSSRNSRGRARAGHQCRDTVKRDMPGPCLLPAGWRLVDKGHRLATRCLRGAS